MKKYIVNIIKTGLVINCLTVVAMFSGAVAGLIAEGTLLATVAVLGESECIMISQIAGGIGGTIIEPLIPRELVPDGEILGMSYASLTVSTVASIIGPYVAMVGFPFIAPVVAVLEIFDVIDWF